MKTRRAGKRYHLLIYNRWSHRYRGSTLLIGLLLVTVWVTTWFGYFPELLPPFDTLTLVTGIASLVFTVFIRQAPKMNYVQAFADHLRVVTPFLRLKVSYRRVKGVNPTDFHRLFPAKNLRRSEKHILAPFYGQTVLTLRLNALPMSRGALRLFLPRHMFLPDSPGFVFTVADWMALSTEIDSALSTWRESRRERPHTPGLPGSFEE